jgi:ATP-dependent Clp protease ATP-binding subunit ClpA
LAATSISWPADGKLDPVIGRQPQIDRTIPDSVPPHQE